MPLRRILSHFLARRDLYSAGKSDPLGKLINAAEKVKEDLLLHGGHIKSHILSQCNQNQLNVDVVLHMRTNFSGTMFELNFFKEYNSFTKKTPILGERSFFNAD